MRWALATLLSAAIALLLHLGRPATARAGTIFVGPTCSLSDAIQAANSDLPVAGCFGASGPDEIRLPPGTFIPLSAVDHVGPGGAGATALPAIRTSVLIRPRDANSVAVIARIGSAPDMRIFQVEAGGSLTLQRLDIQNGRLLGLTAEDRGGCVEARAGSVRLALEEVTLNDCASGADATAVFSRAADTSIRASAITRSEALRFGPSAAVRVGGLASLENSTFSANDGAAFALEGGAGTITHCTFVGDGGPATIEATLSGTLTLRNTLLLGATTTSTGGSVVLEGVNVVDAAAVVEPLGVNGGLSPSHLPADMGPTIDVADLAFCPPSDQRRVTRPQGLGCDVGAVEREEAVLETCGNAVLDDGEECDEGGASALCDVDCTLALCGDGLLNALAGESCDDGLATRFCNEDCSRVVCGDRVVSAAAGEQCDDGEASSSCDDDCTIVECGDRNVNAAAGEECDDGNEEDFDGCSRRCRLERDAGPRADAGPLAGRDAGPMAGDAGPEEGGGGCAVGRRENGAAGALLLALLALVSRRRRSAS